MMNTHSNTGDCGGAPSSALGPAVSSLLSTMSGMSTGLLFALLHRVAMRRIERFSDRRLNDIGFERDWDSSVIHRVRSSAPRGLTP